MSHLTLYLVATPFISAFIGWITTWLAIKMLFRPRVERRVLGMRIQGVFPKRQALLAQKLGEVVSAQLFSMQDLRARLNSETTVDELVRLLDGYLETVLWQKLPKALPMLAMFISPGLVQTVKETMVQDIRPVIHSALDKVGDRLAAEVDVHEIVRARVEQLSGERVEEMLLSIMKSQFTFLEVVSVVLGFVIGLGQVGLALL
ncbi:MAG: DUF445 family protein [Proteobacteria bacterium]|nr:DUF445 family protein [Pseudomonadota bacterium]